MNFLKNFTNIKEPLYNKLQEDMFKNKEFHGEKVIIVKKGNFKEAKSKLNNNEKYFCNEPPKPKGHIIKMIETNEIDEIKMDVEDEKNNNYKIKKENEWGLDNIMDEK